MRIPALARIALTSLVLGLVCAAGAFAQAQPAGQTASQFYIAYRAAFDKATKMDDILPWMAEKNRTQAAATPADEREKMFGLVKIMGTLTDVKVLKETRTADGATLTVTGLDSEKQKSEGTVEIIKEKGAWKMGKESWKSGPS